MATAASLLIAVSDPAHAASAEENYRHYCAQCHGEQGKGDGINARLIPVEPRNHTDSVEMSKLSDAKLFEAISSGGFAVNKSTLMPYFEHTFTKEEIQALVAYLRKLCNCKGP
jgi:mono/diheme cytochrome c family protein